MSSNVYQDYGSQSFDELLLSRKEVLLWKSQSKKLFQVLHQDEIDVDPLELVGQVFHTFISRTELANSSAFLDFKSDLQYRQLRFLQMRIASSPSGANIWQVSFMQDIRNFLLDERIQALALKQANQIGLMLFKQAEIQAARRDELMKFEVHLAEKKYPGFRAYVMDTCEVPTFLETAGKSLDQSISLIIRHDVHYMAAIVRRVGLERLALVGEPAKDDRALILKDYLIEAWGPTGIIGAEDRIQFDRSNCAHFSLDFLVQAHKSCGVIDALLGEIESGDRSSFLWRDMPPQFVRMSNSMSQMKTYIDADKARAQTPFEGEETLESYIAKATIQKLVRDQVKEVNGAMERHIKSIQSDLPDQLKELSESALNHLVYQPAWSKLVEDQASTGS